MRFVRDPRKGRSALQLKALRALVEAVDKGPLPKADTMAKRVGYASHGALMRAMLSLNRRGDVTLGPAFSDLRPTEQGRRVANRRDC